MWWDVKGVEDCFWEVVMIACILAGAMFSAWVVHGGVIVLCACVHRYIRVVRRCGTSVFFWGGHR